MDRPKRPPGSFGRGYLNSRSGQRPAIEINLAARIPLKQPLHPDENRSQSDVRPPVNKLMRRWVMRLWAMRLIAMLIGCLPFLALELALRILDDSTTQAIDRDPYVGLHQLRPLFVLNDDSSRWEIPPSRYNFFHPESFPAKKTPGTRRVFVLGGSTVQGRPYSTETAFSTWLRLSLESADSHSKYEVINCGGVSYASYRVAKILEEVLQHQPDAIVLYTGHNEFLEDRTYAHVRDMGTASSWATAIGSKLHTVGWVQSLFASPIEVTELAAEVDARQDHPGGFATYQRDPIWRRGVEQHFAAKLDQIVKLSLGQNLPLIMCVPASDLVNTPPIKTQTRTDWTNDEECDFQSAWSIARDSALGPPQRIDAARQCLGIDREHAGANYILGRLLYDQGKNEEARKHLVAARDNDVCPLRAPTAIIEATRQISNQYAVPLIDTPKLLDERNFRDAFIRDQVPDPGRFVDHVHPSIAGHQRIAEALALEFEKLGWIELNKESTLRFDMAAKAHLRGLGEDYYHRGKQRLKGLRLWATGRAGKLATEMVDDPPKSPDNRKVP